MRRGLVVVAMVALLAAAVPPAVPLPGPTLPIQPGAPLGSPAYCTLNFVFRDATDWYVGAAGHCVTLGERVRNGEAGEFGTVVFDEAGVTDFGLIRIDASKVNLVSAAVRAWGGPTGVATPSSAGAGDLLVEFGYGLGFSASPFTRPRAGILLDHDAFQYVADTGAVNGDSGAPLLAYDDGQAVGIISHYKIGVPPATDEGPTVQHILNRLDATGFDVALQLAPFDPIPD